MRLFHSTNEATTVLQPMVGRNRHGAEAADAVGQPAVWLSSEPMWHFENRKPYRFRYTVEVAKDDPHLHEDKSVGEMGARTLRMLGGGADVEPNRYYYLTRAAEVMAVEEWNDSLGDYALVPTSEVQ
jgi:hypothetical protein